MKASDIEVGATYYVETLTYPARRIKATVVAVPVVRMTDYHWNKAETPYRRDGRADGARVRIEEPYAYAGKNVSPGTLIDVALPKVLRPWTDADDHARQTVREQDDHWAKLTELAKAHEILVERNGPSHARISFAHLERLLAGES
jgi:hypothetical protein